MFKDLWEKIFRRKELAKYKNSAAILEGEVEEKTRQIKLLTSGVHMKITEREAQMILLAIEYKAFQKNIQLPATKAYVRLVWREIREKIKLHIKKIS